MRSPPESGPDIDLHEHRDLNEYACERLAPHREHLKRLAALDTALSEDAKKALRMLDEAEQAGLLSGAEGDE